MNDKDSQKIALTDLFGQFPGMPPTDPEVVARIRREKMEDDERLRDQVLNFNDKQNQQALRQQQEAHAQNMAQQTEIWELRNQQIEHLVNLAAAKRCEITIKADGTVEVKPACE